MNEVNQRKPLPHEHKEIARGSGPAAILLFFHIAVSGYLAYLIWFLLAGNTAVFWNLVPFSAALVFYFPAAFAILTYMPTDPLTRKVGRVAQIMGAAAVCIFMISLAIQTFKASDITVKPGIITACAVVAGICGGLLVRILFRFGIPQDRKL